jgi:ketosteroid isomerase-like protein
MSQENVEIVRRMVQAFNSDEPRLAFSAFHPEIEFASIGNALDGSAYVGLDGMERYADDLEAIFEHWHSEDDRIIDAGEERVIWLHRIVGRAKASEFPVDQPMGIVWRLRDGLIWRGQAYLGHADALKAVGLAE